MQAARRNMENPTIVIKPAAARGQRKPLVQTSNLQPKATVREKMVKAESFKIPKPSKVSRVTRSSSSVEKPGLEKLSEIKESLPVVQEYIAPKELPPNVENIDAEDAENPQLISIYVNDIYQYMRMLEDTYPIKQNHLLGQPDITGKMRAVLVDWLVQVHMKFHLLQETLYMTISILDRFLQMEKVKRGELQLVGVTAMFIASKYEEMYAPEVGDFAYITDNTYTKSQILKMECSMLRKLDYNLSKPLPVHFLRRNSKAGNVDATMHTLAKYLMEIVLPEYELAHCKPSHLAAASSYLSLRLLGEQPWSETLQHYSHYSEEEVLPLVKCLCKILLKMESCKLKAVYHKYASSKLMKISETPELKSTLVKTLAVA